MWNHCCCNEYHLNGDQIVTLAYVVKSVKKSEMNNSWCAWIKSGENIKYAGVQAKQTPYEFYLQDMLAQVGVSFLR